jgi:hypothetical protein
MGIVFVKAALLHGLLFDRKRLPSALVSQKFGPQTKNPNWLWHYTTLPEEVHEDGHDIPDTLEPPPIYNDNEVCVCWLHNMTTKQIQHMEVCENSVWE